jgi:hypothetical protein
MNRQPKSKSVQAKAVREIRRAPARRPLRMSRRPSVIRKQATIMKMMQRTRPSVMKDCPSVAYTLNDRIAHQRRCWTSQNRASARTQLIPGALSPPRLGVYSETDFTTAANSWAISPSLMLPDNIRVRSNKRKKKKPRMNARGLVPVYVRGRSTLLPALPWPCRRSDQTPWDQQSRSRSGSCG